MKLFLLMVISIVVIFVPMAQAETPVDSTAYVFDCLCIRGYDNDLQ